MRPPPLDLGDLHRVSEAGMRSLAIFLHLTTALKNTTH